MQEKSQKLKLSVTTRSLMLLILLTIGILLCMEAVSLYNMNIYQKRTLENYENSVQEYCDFWDAKLSVVNNAMLNLINADNGGDLSFWTICNRDSGLDFETSKVTLRSRITEIAKESGENILLFSYVPSKGLYLKSTNQLVEMGKRNQLDQAVQNYVDQVSGYNSVKWDYFQYGDDSYFINAFALYGGYVGALIPCDEILSELLEGKGMICEAAFLDPSDHVIQTLYGEYSSEWEKVYSFFIPMEYVKCRIRVSVLENRLFTERSFTLWLLAGTAVIGLVLMVWNIRFQMVHILGPLNRLKRAMEDFSRGRLETRLPVEKKAEEEMGLLFGTFNDMAGQITDLKIAVYESKLEQERISSNYMRVQIQPHFYANILNLIYGLAQIKDYQAISKLSIVTGAYFRYLMGEKGTFVRLQEEIGCVENYIEIQKMRYEGSLSFTLEVCEELGDQMVLPMVLQTFVGNCIKHNITLVPMLKVMVRIWRQDGQLYLVIEDNGRGFDPEVLRKINAGEEIEKDGEHIGIRNVMERIRLFYNGKGSMTIESSSAGAAVTMILPEVITEEERNEYHIGG